MTARAKDGQTCLHIAARYGHHKVVTAICLTQQIEINSTTTFLWTPLHFACNHQHVAVAAILIDMGADINVLNSDRRLPFQCLSDPEHVQLLVDFHKERHSECTSRPFISPHPQCRSTEGSGEGSGEGAGTSTSGINAPECGAACEESSSQPSPSSWSPLCRLWQWCVWRAM